MLARTLRVVVLLGVVAAMLLPTPAMAATTGFSLVTRAREIVHDGEVYRVRLHADRYSFDGFSFESLAVSISRKSDPDGDGPLQATRTAYWSFSDADALDVEGDLSSATLQTGTQLAPFGSIDYAFEATEPAKTTCGGEERSRAGRLKGTLVFKTKSRFGTLSFNGWNARVTKLSGMGCSGLTFGEGPLPCPPGSRSLFAFTPRQGDGFGALQGRNRARVFAGTSTPLIVGSPNVMASLEAVIFVAMPAKRVQIDEELGTATIRGAAGVPLKGKAVFQSRRGATTIIEPCGPRSDRTESVVTTRPGVVTGDLRANMLIGDDMDLRGVTLKGEAQRTYTQPR